MVKVFPVPGVPYTSKLMQLYIKGRIHLRIYCIICLERIRFMSIRTGGWKWWSFLDKLKHFNFCLYHYLKLILSQLVSNHISFQVIAALIIYLIFMGSEQLYLFIILPTILYPSFDFLYLLFISQYSHYFVFLRSPPIQNHQQLPNLIYSYQFSFFQAVSPFAIPKHKVFFISQPSSLIININNTYNQYMLRRLIYLILIITLINLTKQAVAPFIPLNEIHQVTSEFQFNLILNENRHIPIIMMQYCEDKTQKKLKVIVENALKQEKDISFALFIDCRKFNYDLNNTLGICKGFSQYQQQNKDDKSQQDTDDPDKITDPFLKLDLFTPNPTRIIQKGHKLARNHDIQNLRQLGVAINFQFLAKVIRNQIPDFVTYIEDNHDLSDFLKLNSTFRLSKGPKLLYFDQNLQSPKFLKKLAVNLDGWIQIGVSDSSKIAENFGCRYEDILLLQYDFEFKKYVPQRLSVNLDSQQALRDIMNLKEIKSYTDIRKPRDILLDFEHRAPIIYNLTNPKQINQLISHGRIIVLQISASKDSFDCYNLQELVAVSQVIFNYVCLSKASGDKFIEATGLAVKKHSFFMIDGSLKSTKLVDIKSRNFYGHLPKVNARQQISTSYEGQLCMKAARSADKQPLFYYFNEKTHAQSLNLIKYLASLSEINSIIYFCQFYLPDEDVVSTYQLAENTLFTLGSQDHQGQLQKIEHKKVENFLAVKMFIREVSISKIMKVYDEKIVKNQIKEIKSAQQLTKNCFNEKCIIGLLQTGTFHQETELKILKQMQVLFSEEGFKYYWIDGKCHFEVGKQLKLTEKGAKFIDRSFLFLYKEKSNDYALWKGGKINKFWDKKNVFRWVKSLRNSQNIGRIKFGIDLQDKQCIRQEQIKQLQKQAKNQKSPSRNQKKSEVNPDQL